MCTYNIMANITHHNANISSTFLLVSSYSVLRKFTDLLFQFNHCTLLFKLTPRIAFDTKHCFVYCDVLLSDTGVMRYISCYWSCKINKNHLQLWMFFLHFVNLLIEVNHSGKVRIGDAIIPIYLRVRYWKGFDRKKEYIFSAGTDWSEQKQQVFGSLQVRCIISHR